MGLPSVVHHGGAVQLDSGTHRLKNLVAVHHTDAGTLRVLAADEVSPGELQLELSNGERELVKAPGTQASQPLLAVINAGQLLTMQGAGVGLRVGGTVICRGAQITEVISGPDPVSLPDEATVVDARGGLVTPGLVDPHTHPVFGGQRSLEFGLKAEGKSYMEIHKAGGGILSTVRSTREASRATLEQVCARNLSDLLAWGVTTCEAKSGYALEPVGELRLLEVLRTVGDCHPLDVVPTLLGAHTLPPEHADRREDYLQQVIEQMIPVASQRGLARYCDAYCEDGAFTIEEVRRIFEAAAGAGLGLRLHAEQFTHQGGAELAAAMGAATADHLEAISPAGIQALAAAATQTTAVLLPGAALNCRCPWPPARELLDAGASVALGTDLNPGSSFTASLPLMMSLGCVKLQMSCEEVWRAVTVEPARSLGLGRRVGQLAPGFAADLVVFDAPDYRYVPYRLGQNLARTVIKSGRVVSA